MKFNTGWHLNLALARISWTSLKSVPRSDEKENDNNDEGQCGGIEDVEAAVEIVLVRSESMGEGDDAQHLLADQDRWRARLGNRSPQVSFISL